jgi:disulfide bond formation protein DsbB
VIDILNKIGGSSRYWLALLALGIAMEALALTYQYILEYQPCVLCIHVRIWVMGFMLVALLGLLTRNNRILRTAAHALTVMMMAGMLDRSWMLFGTERGFVEGSCNFDLGLPAWLALDAWFPAIFKVWEACGYTPELLFGITMAEALLVISAALLLAAIVLTIATALGGNRD